jgi:hypothetical protein
LKYLETRPDLPNIKHRCNCDGNHANKVPISIDVPYNRAVLIIRTEQMAALAADARRRANADLAEYARRRFPTLFAEVPDDALLRLSEDARSSAYALGVKREDLVATWLDLIVMYGRDFAQSEWAAPIINDRCVDPETRLLSLTALVESTGVKL